MPVTLTLPSAEVEAIAFSVEDSARCAQFDGRLADAACYWRRAGMLFATAGIAGEADHCLRMAEDCISVLEGSMS